ncbi:uncharacterized protein LOC109404515 [Aedes albopictus]|uniref:PHD-type domain-containing protein n=1 Tax=Aedes albopictus TaxID=7160 RepID=A0ABM1ZCC6_AEDAL|nr:uncharacterized protein LOC109404515 [Aedes albopictus]
MEICNSCAIHMSAPEVVCGGFCKATFHYKCAPVSEAFYEEMQANPAAYWMCKDCREIMGNARFKNTVKSMNDATKEINDVYSKLVDDLKSEIKESLIAELRQEIQGGFNRLSPAVLSPAPSRFQFNRPALKRTRERDEVVAALSERPSKVLQGTNQSTTVTVGPADTSVSKFWIYLTKISPEATEDDILNLARRCLQTEDVVAKALIPKGRPPSTLSFVSFKVGVSQELKCKALDPCTWPPQVQFREFIETTSNFQPFWKPSQRTDPGPSSVPEPHPTSAPAVSLNLH